MTTDAPRPGQCYLNALAAFLAAPQQEDCVLVHGYPRLTKAFGRAPVGTKFGHAWLEIKEQVVFDSGTAQYIPRDIYYDVGGIDETELTRYDAEQIKAMCDKHKHCGPWNDVPADAIFANRGR